MTIALVIISVLLVISILGNMILWRMLKTVVKLVNELTNAEQELAFCNGEIDIPEADIEQIFPNAIIMCHLEKNTLSSDETLKIVDISSYEKNHLIGLTYLVQPQFFDSLKAQFQSPDMRNELKRRIMESGEYDPEELDDEYLAQILNDAIQEVLGDEYHFDENEGTMTRPLIPNCTVYQLKDGRWLWR